MNKYITTLVFVLMSIVVFAQKTESKTATKPKSTKPFFTASDSIKKTRINNEKPRFISDSITILNADAVSCKSADDSIAARRKRGEVSFYLPTKYSKNQYFYYIISKNKYIKKQMPEGFATKTFLSCYNKAAQKTLDTTYKVDFFRKADSILNIYDKTGRGYRNADFPGGVIALQKFLEKNIVLPTTAKPSDADKSIRVYYSFVVDEKGVISNYELLKSNCKDCEELVLAAIKKMPNFVPATDAGVYKKVKYILPFAKPIQ
jgi:hypothetical protein